MRRTLSILFALMLLLPLAGCKQGGTPPEEESQSAFNAMVLEVYEGGSVLVEPFADEEAILRSADRITFGKNSLVSGASMPELAAGDTIRITFDGTSPYFVTRSATPVKVPPSLIGLENNQSTSRDSNGKSLVSITACKNRLAFSS